MGDCADDYRASLVYLSNLTVKYENSVYFVWYYGFYLYMREV